MPSKLQAVIWVSLRPSAPGWGSALWLERRKRTQTTVSGHPSAMSAQRYATLKAKLRDDKEKAAEICDLRQKDVKKCVR